MISFSLSEIAKITIGQIIGNSNRMINQFVIDSRKNVFDDHTTFIAIKGSNHDGHSFIEELIDKGVKSFIINKDFKEPLISEITFIKVEDTMVSLQQLGLYHRLRVSYPILGITGSNGKTIVKEWIAQVAGDSISINKSPKSFNSQVGVPLSMLLFEEEGDLGVVEVGISLPGEMIKQKRMIQPNWGLITNIGQAHQENFTSIEEKLKEKLLLLKGCEKVFFCIDNDLIFRYIKSECNDCQLISWGKNPAASLIILETTVKENSTKIKLMWNENVEFGITIPFIDEASFENVMHSLVVLLEMGIEPKNLSERVPLLKPVAMRLEQKEGRRGCLIINDTYNSDFTSLEVAMDFLNQQARAKKMPRTLILSDMYQSGIASEELYRRVAQLIEIYEVDRFIGVGATLSESQNHFDSKAKFYITTNEFIESGVLKELHDQVVLIKGSRDFQFERIAELLEQKHHQTVLEIDLNALRTNLNTFRSLLKPNVKMLAMVKAFSYGSGSFEIAGLLQYQRIDYLGVAFADEGRELRHAGINLPIIVLNPEKKSFVSMIQNQLEPEIYSEKVLLEFVSVMKDEGVSSYPIHIKIDTGMKRLGFTPNQIPRLIEQLKQYSKLKVQSVFSHLAGSEDDMHDEFTNRQIKLFQQASDELINGLGYNICRHILNSAGVERFPDAQFDMVRLGIGLYGISAMKNANIKGIATLKSYVSQIKTISGDETVGYGRKGFLTSKGRIATIPIGYADGLDRRLGNGVGEFLINGFKVKTVGNICMDICMVDVTNVPCEEEDEVIIFGPKLPIEKIADKMGTIPYEVLTSVSRRVSRVYFQE